MKPIEFKRLKLNENENNDYLKLIETLKLAMEISLKNIDKADNFDLHDLSEVLENYIGELNEIGKFEIYPEEHNQ